MGWNVVVRVEARTERGDIEGELSETRRGQMAGM